MKMNKTLLAGAASVLFISSVSAQETTNFDVSATVVDSCSVTSTALAFSNVDPVAGTQTDGTSTVTVTCSNGTTYDVGLGGGSGTVATRTLTAGLETLNYNLYSDTGRTTVWGDTVSTDTVAGSGTGATQDLTVYGQVAAGQSTVATGSYTDNITVTVTF